MKFDISSRSNPANQYGIVEAKEWFEIMRLDFADCGIGQLVEECILECQKLQIGEVYNPDRWDVSIRRVE